MKLKIWMMEQGMRQSEVSYVSGIDLASLNRFINGRKDLSEKHLSKLANTLGVSIEEVKAKNIKRRR